MKSALRAPKFWYVAGALLVVLMMLYPLLASQVQSIANTPPYEPTRITDYQAEFVVGDQGSMEVAERITVDFPEGNRHGIFRFFDRHDPHAPGARRVPQDVSVEVDPEHADEQPADDEVRTSTAGWGRYDVVRIGSEIERVPAGEHVYVMRYRIDDVLLAHDEASRFSWNLIPGGWSQPIEKAELTATFPGPTSEPTCAIDAGEIEVCETVVDDPTTVRVTAVDLPPRTPLDLDADVAVDPKGAAELPWSVRWDPVLGDDEGQAVLLLVLGGLALVGGIGVSLRTRDPLTPATTGGARLPELGPARSGYLITKRLSPGLSTATIFEAAARGEVEIEYQQAHGTPTLMLRAARDVTRHDLDEPTERLVRWVRDSPRRVDGSSGEGRRSGKWLDRENDRIRRWALAEGYLVEDRWWAVRLAAVVAAAAVAVVLVIVRPVGTLAGLPPALFALGAAYSIRPDARLRRTSAGREQAELAVAVQRLITVPPNDADVRTGFDNYLPWAVALACTTQWSATNKMLGGNAPGWLVAPNERAPAAAVVGATDTFESTVASSIEAYEFSPRASISGGTHSGGGSGFSGGGFTGGGGGGGGGGSW